MMNKKSTPELEINALINAGIFKDRKEFLQEACNTLLTVKPQMRLEAAIQLFKDGEITLGRGAEIAGISRYEFKDILEDRGIKIIIEPDSPKEMDRRVEKVMGRK